MKATKIYYQKCFNLGNYQNEVIGIELQMDEGEKDSDVLDYARMFVNAGNDKTAINIVENPNEDLPY
jgi:hypothetical protein